MSFPNIPNITPTISITTAQTIPLLLASIALEELALAHIINAEAEKIQFVLGTLDTGTTLSPPVVSLSNLLAIDSSVQRTLRDVIKKEMLLEFKFENVLDLLAQPVLLSTQTFTGPLLTTVTVPSRATTARITAIGAQGGNGTGSTTGGLGASLQGDFSVTPGEILTILVGQRGGDGVVEAGGGGGGGSFVWRGMGVAALTLSSLLIAAGAGGGGGDVDDTTGFPGRDAMTGPNGTGGNPQGGAGGVNGMGGGAGAESGGGAGIFSDGGDPGSGNAQGGTAINAGGAGGTGINLVGFIGGNGGFGGGGGAGDGGGGAGGFSGGGGGNALSGSDAGGGGGGSFNAGSNQINMAGVGTGNGQVTISFFGI